MATIKHDGLNWHAFAHIDKYGADVTEELTRFLGRKPEGRDFEEAGADPYLVTEMDGNALTTAGLARITNLITAGGGTAYTNTTGRIGTGNGTSAFSAGQTDLQASSGSSNRWFQALDGSYPSVSNGVMTSRATFGTSDGNYAWEEWCWDIGTATVSSGATVNSTMLNRKVASLGTKASGASWVFTTTITLS